MTSSSPNGKPRGDYTLPDGRVISWVALVQMLLALQPRRCPDITTAARVFGDAVFNNLGEVAAAFGVSPTTVKKDWRHQGMPGTEGAWPVAELFRWHVNRIANRTN
jgi:hypothetical protein